MTLGSFKNGNIRTYFVEVMRRKLTEMGKKKLENSIQLSQGKCRNTGKRDSRRTGKGDNNEYLHQRMLQESSKNCSDM